MLFCKGKIPRLKLCKTCRVPFVPDADVGTDDLTAEGCGAWSCVQGLAAAKRHGQVCADGSTSIEIQYRLPNGTLSGFRVADDKFQQNDLIQGFYKSGGTLRCGKDGPRLFYMLVAQLLSKHEIYFQPIPGWNINASRWFFKESAGCEAPLDMLEKERTLISKLYRTAIGWRDVDANLASVLKVEGRKSPEREIFTDEQVTLILSQKNTPTGQMVIALLACGVRIYELLHFKHEDFHRTESGAYLIGGCKTEAGRNRIIPILDFGIPVFEHAYATSVENGPLFPNGKGGFWNEKNWRNRKFYPFLEEIGIQPNPYDENGKRKPEFAGKLATYTPYTTRHTYASLCDRAGVNKDILKRAVGHTPKSKTLDEVYLHPKATQMIEAFDKANQLVNDEVLALPEE